MKSTPKSKHGGPTRTAQSAINQRDETAPMGRDAHRIARGFPEIAPQVAG